jgi:hypothetical protein
MNEMTISYVKAIDLRYAIANMNSPSKANAIPILGEFYEQLTAFVRSVENNNKPAQTTNVD